MNPFPNSPQDIEKITQAINNILKTKTSLKRKKLKKDLPEKQVFIDIVTAWEESLDKEAFMVNEMGLDFVEHNSSYHFIISNLIELKYGTELSKIIHFYIYESKGPNGGRKLTDELKHPIKLDTPTDLWNFIVKLAKK